MNQILEPHILTANTYFHKPCGDKRKAEYITRLNLGEVYEYFQALGMNATIVDCCVIGKLYDIEVEFYYEHKKCSIRKSLIITRNGKRSNITTLRNINKIKRSGKIRNILTT